MKKKNPLINSSLKNEWISITNKDIGYWLGQYLMAALVIHAYKKKLGCPDRVGKIEDMVENKDGSGTIPYQAQWD